MYSGRKSGELASWPRVHSARLVPVVDASAEAREYFAEAPAGMIELDALAAERFTVGRTYAVHIEEIVEESC